MGNYKLVKVTIDGQNSFDAYILSDKKWNGFVLPYFTKTVGQQLCSYLNRYPDSYVVMNLTDGIIATPILSRNEAVTFLEHFSKKFQGQGYYLTADGTKIKPQDVRLEIQPVSDRNRNPKAEYDELMDAFIILEEGDSIAYAGENILFQDEEIRVYPIGTGSWIWSEATQFN